MAAVRTRTLVTTMAVILVLAGCTGDGDDDQPAATTTTSTAVATTVPEASTTTTPATTTPATTTVPAGAAAVLRPDGLGVVAFGATKDATLASLTALFGSVDETGTGCELAGPDVTTARWDELRVQFVDQVFDSYNVRPPNGVATVLDLRTEAGIGIGSTVAQLKAAYGPALAIPGLPPEFGGDDFGVTFPGTDRRIFGALSATVDSGTVRTIFTQVCE